jgi:hypothetical protein
VRAALTLDLETIYACDTCLRDGQPFAQKCFSPADNGLLKKHPPIGFGRHLFFVNINPRSTNNAAMEWAMQNIDNFKRFAANRHENHAYIPGSEEFYRIHAAICNSIFPGRPVEEVAIVHELYLCASPNKGGLPGSASPCADQYLRPHLLEAKPGLVITFGSDPAEYFGVQADGSHALVRISEDYKVHVLALPFPRMWSNDLRVKTARWVALCFEAISSNGALPERDFKWPQRDTIESYALQPLTQTVQSKVDALRPQARACLQILLLGGKTVFGEAELKMLIKCHASLLKTRQRPWRIFTYYRRDLRRAGAITWKEGE